MVALNHLFAQGRVAIETLRYDLDAREKFLAKLDELAPGHPSGHVVQHAGDWKSSPSPGTSPTSEACGPTGTGATE